MMVISSDGRFFNACHLWRSQIGFSTAEKVVKKFNAEFNASGSSETQKTQRTLPHKKWKSH